MGTIILDEILRHHIALTLAEYVLWVGLLLILIVVNVIYYFVTRSSKPLGLWRLLPWNRNAKARYTTEELIVIAAVCIAILIGLAFWTITPMYNDLKGQQYVCVESAVYIHTVTTGAESSSAKRAKIETNGEWLTLKLPDDWSEEDFPLGEYTGTVWYSKESKILLAFEPE